MSRQTIVVVKERASGNESVGIEWVETAVFTDRQTLAEVLEWHDDGDGRLMLTIAEDRRPSDLRKARGRTS